MACQGAEFGARLLLLKSHLLTYGFELCHKRLPSDEIWLGCDCSTKIASGELWTTSLSTVSEICGSPGS